MLIQYWSDYACPYCYIGETHLKKALGEIQAERGILAAEDIEMRAFELNPQASVEYTGETVNRFAAKYGLSLQKAAEQIEAISQMGRNAGLDFNYAQTRYTNTFDAHRLTKAAQFLNKRESADRISERLYKAYFSEGMELADREVLVKIAVEEGMEEKEVRRILDSEKYADAVRFDEQEAARYGIHSVPYFVLDGKVAIPGAFSVEQMKRILLEIADKEEKLKQEEGISCGPDGCHIG